MKKTRGFHWEYSDRAYTVRQFFFFLLSTALHLLFFYLLTQKIAPQQPLKKPPLQRQAPPERLHFGNFRTFSAQQWQQLRGLPPRPSSSRPPSKLIPKPSQKPLPPSSGGNKNPLTKKLSLSAQRFSQELQSTRYDEILFKKRPPTTMTFSPSQVHPLQGVPHPRAQQIYNNSSLGVTVTSGKKAEDPLNSKESQYYGFFQRVSQIYSSSVYRAIRKFLQKYPHLQNTGVKGSHEMLSELRFDATGDITSRKNVLESPDPKIQYLFEQVMDLIYKIPNPPIGLLNQEEASSPKGEFVVYFSLKIRGN